MIVRCPECSTGFKLPDERLTPKGVKLRCSRCKHVFRVRSDEAGEVEFYNRPGDNEEGSGEGKASKSSSPFPHAGLDLKPKKSSAFGDLKGEDDEEMKAFKGAFDEEDEPETLEIEAMTEELESEKAESPTFRPPPPAARKPPVKVEASEDEAEAQEEEKEEEDKKEAEKEEEKEASGEVAPLMGRGTDFGDPEDLVDPSFGMDGAHFDPEKGKVEAPAPGPAPTKKKGGGPPSGARASGRPPTEQHRSRAKKEDAAKAEPLSAASEGWDEADFEPHRIGGSAGMKVVTLLLLLALVVMGFFGTVAALNDGFIDFKAFPQMLEVAFADGEYEPRAEWIPQRPATVVRAPADPVTVETVHGELVSVGRGGNLFVARGMVRNTKEQSVRGLELRGMITTPEGRVLRQVVVPVGEDVAISEFRALGNTDDAGDLLGSGVAELNAGEMAPFTMLFADVPQTVIDGERFLIRVEVANGPAPTGEPVAAQD